MKKKRSDARQRLTAANRKLLQQVDGERVQREAAEKALETERALTGALLGNSRSLIVVFDRWGRIIRFNEASQQTTGYTFNEVKDKHIWDLFLMPEDVEPVKALFGQIVAGRFPLEFENEWLARDGRHVLISWSNTALLDKAGAVRCVIATGVDITGRKLAEEALRKSEKRFTAISALVREGIIIINERGRISFWNDQAARIFGHSADDVLGKELHPLLKPNGNHKHDQRGRRPFLPKNGGRRARKTVEWFGVKEDGRTFSKALDLSWARIRGAKQIIGVVRDIRETEKVQAGSTQPAPLKKAS
jgi:PAS domain S-box-containing protein